MIVPTFLILLYFRKIAADEDYERDIVTVCNSTYCDELEPINWCLSPSDLHVYVTSESGDRFLHSVINFEDECNPSGSAFTITVNPNNERRRIIGFGGSLTDATALMISCLSPEAKKKLLNSYFNCDTGIGYYLLRTPIGGCDFSEKRYTYNDVPEPDPKLEKFALDEMDTEYKIPLIKEAQAISCREIRIKAATWYSPLSITEQGLGNMTEIFFEALPQELASLFVYIIPDNYKTYPQERIKEAYEKTWALYLAKTISEYERYGININYLTPGNEPQLGAVSTYWSRDRFQRWSTEVLCPTLKENGLDSVNLLLLDDQTLFLPYWQEILENPATKSCFKGAATHWYFDYFPDYVKIIHDDFCEKYPDHILLPTEASTCEHDPNFFITSDWDKAVRYAKDIIVKLSSCGQGYIDWNMVLDFRGGPNWINNYCYAAVAVNCTADEFHKRVLFYVLGHFSKFIPEGSVNVEVIVIANDEAGSELEPLQVVAFKVQSLGLRGPIRQPNIVIIALNTNEEDVKADICLYEGKCATVEVSKNSIMSAVLLLP